MSGWDKERVEKFGYAVSNLIADYVGQLETASVFPKTDPVRLEAELSRDLSDTGEDPFALLDEIRTHVLPHSMNIPSPNYYGLINPAPTLIGVFAEAIAAAINQNVGAWSQSPAATIIEKSVIDWLCRLIGYPDTAFGTLTSGGTLANISALKLALTWKFPETKQQGLTALGRPIIFYISEECHFSFDRAVDFVGVGRECLRKIPTDNRFRIRTELLESAIDQDLADGNRPCGIVGIAGTTSTGNVDPLKDLAGVARKYKLWYHVDAAYGGPAVLSRKWPGMIDGVELADSVTIDPHKWLFVPFVAGAILVRDRQVLRDSFHLQPAYIPQKTADGEETLNFFQLGVLGTRRFDALKIWMSLRHHGLDWYRDVIDRQIELSHRLAELAVAEPDWHVVNPVEMGIVCLRYVPRSLRNKLSSSSAQAREIVLMQIDQLNSRIQQVIQASGRAWISTTKLDGRTALRINVISYRTREDHIDSLFALLKESAAQAARGI